MLKTVEEWLPEGSGEAAKVVAIQTYVKKAQLDMAELDSTAKEVSEKAIQTLNDLGLEAQVNAVQREIAIKFSTLREKYARVRNSASRSCVQFRQ